MILLSISSSVSPPETRVKFTLRFAFVRDCRTRQIMIIQPGLTDCSVDFFASSRNGVMTSSRGLRVIWMNAA